MNLHQKWTLWSKGLTVTGWCFFGECTSTHRICTHGLVKTRAIYWPITFLALLVAEEWLTQSKGDLFPPSRSWGSSMGLCPYSQKSRSQGAPSSSDWSSKCLAAIATLLLTIPPGVWNADYLSESMWCPEWSGTPLLRATIYQVLTLARCLHMSSNWILTRVLCLFHKKET